MNILSNVLISSFLYQISLLRFLKVSLVIRISSETLSEPLLEGFCIPKTPKIISSTVNQIKSDQFILYRDLLTKVSFSRVISEIIKIVLNDTGSPEYGEQYYWTIKNLGGELIIKMISI